MVVNALKAGTATTATTTVQSASVHMLLVGLHSRVGRRSLVERSRSCRARLTAPGYIPPQVVIRVSAAAWKTNRGVTRGFHSCCR